MFQKTTRTIFLENIRVSLFCKEKHILACQFCGRKTETCFFAFGGVLFHIWKQHTYFSVCRMCAQQQWMPLKDFYPCGRALIYPDIKMVFLSCTSCIPFLYGNVFHINKIKSPWKIRFSSDVFLFHMALTLCKMTGPHAVRVHFLGELLGLMVQQKRLLISDKNVLSSLLSSLLGNSNDSLLVQHNVGKRFTLCSNSTHHFLL